MPVKGLKNLAKKLLSEGQWRFLSACKTKAVAALKAVKDLSVKILSLTLAWIVHHLPLKDSARVYQSILLTGPLDYPKQKIEIVTRTEKEVRRLRACAKEPETVAWLENEFRQHETLYDIGANIGGYSFVACAITDQQCQVYAFEPSFSTYASLCENIILNGLYGKILPFNVALSDQTRLVDLSYSSFDAGASLHKLYGAHMGGLAKCLESRSTMPVLCYRLDDLISQFKFPKPNHLKIGVDGPELEVLRGAEKTLTSPSLTSILIEVDLELKDKIARFLLGKGFKVSSVHPRSEWVSNYIFKRM